MKKIILSFIILNSLFFILLSGPASAAKPSVTPTPTSKINKPTDSDIINELKDRIASRVAQLNLVERRGIIGTVTDISDTQITISDLQNNTRFIDVDEITKFSSPSAKGSFGISDITKGSRIGSLGLYNKQSRRLLARFVDVLDLPKSVHGAILSIDRGNYTITLIAQNGKKTLVDIESLTKTLSYTKTGGLQKSGFSKIKDNDHIIVFGFQDIKDKNRMIASRILVFPEVPRDPNILIAQPALNADETVVPSTGSGKKLTPITK